MGTNVFISFRYKDGIELKETIEDLFDSNEVYNRSEDVDRSTMSEETIRKYLYEKIRETSVTIVLLTPLAVSYEKNASGQYDDWLYDELRYSLQDRSENRTNGAVAVYTDESQMQLYSLVEHSCSVCNTTSKCKSILSFDNLVRKNMFNVKEEFKKCSCYDVYDSDEDSYISLVHIDKFKENCVKYIENAKSKRDRKEQFDIVKEM